MKQIDVREGARRQHRSVALFAVIQCWLNDLDGVAFQRARLERLLGLDRFKATRVDWLQEDLKDFFPFTYPYYRTKAKGSLHAVFASRVDLAKDFPKGPMPTASRIEGLRKKGKKIDLFKMWAAPSQKDLKNTFEGLVPFFTDSANYDERFLTAYLSLLAQGQISPRALPALKASAEA